MKYIDVHAHIFPDKIAEKVISTLEEYYNFSWQGDGTVSNLLSEMKIAGVEQAVVFSCATKPEQVEPANEFLRNVQAAYPEKFCAFGTIHPDHPDVPGMLRSIRESNLQGIKLHPDFQQIYIDEPAMMRIYEQLDESMVLMIHMGDARTDFSSPYRLARVLDKFPKLKIIAAHFGGYSEWDQVWKHLIGKEVYFDTSSSIFKLGAKEAAKIVRAHGANKILFASDYPAVCPAQAVADVLAMQLTEEENEKIFYLNARRILKNDES